VQRTPRRRRIMILKSSLCLPTMTWIRFINTLPPCRGWP
jgi:hypothetical protein